MLAWNRDLLLPHTRPQTEALLKRRCKKGSATECYQKEAAREFLPLLRLHLRVCSVLGPYVTRAPGGWGGHQRAASGGDELTRLCLTPAARQGVAAPCPHIPATAGGGLGQGTPCLQLPGLCENLICLPLSLWLALSNATWSCTAAARIRDGASGSAGRPRVELWCPWLQQIRTGSVDPLISWISRRAGTCQAIWLICTGPVTNEH